MDPQQTWPALHLEDWRKTYDTLHRWLQVIGKIRLRLSPPLNHTWHCALYLTARGLTTSPLPYGGQTLELRVDLVEHSLSLITSSGRRTELPLRSGTVAGFYADVMNALRELGMEVEIWPVPVEREDRTPLDRDDRPAVYDPAAANRFFRALSQVDQTFKIFMGRFLGKQSPSHFFWGSFDLAQTRFSGRRAPLPPNADLLRREAYSHELISFGFWPGTEGATDAAFYAYAVPEPTGFRESAVQPEGATYSTRLGEFLLPYEWVRQAPEPREELLEFLQSAYDAGSRLAGWDRADLERAGKGPTAQAWATAPGIH